MKRDRLFTGLFLLGIGILFLLDNFQVITFHWQNLISLWPLLLIFWGVTLVFSHQSSTTAKAVKVLVFAILFGLVIYRGTQPTESRFFGRHFNNNTFFDDNNDDDDDRRDVIKLEGSSNYTEPYTPQIKLASLNIRGGGVTYVLQDTTAKLFSAATHELAGRFLFNTTATDSGKAINFTMHNSKNSINWDNDKGNAATIKLNPNPEWNIDISAGASKLDFDLTKFKIRNLHVKGGAASMDFKLGQPTVNNTMVAISTGVSEVNISVPTGAACRIESKTGLSSKDFEGFESKGNNQYETPGFAAAPKKIYLNLKGGISDFKVKRY